MKKLWIIIGIIIAIFVVAFFVNKSNIFVPKGEIKNKGSIPVGPELVPQEMTISIAQPDGSIVPAPRYATFIVHSGNFSFKPNIIKAKQGDTITIILKNNEGTHDLKIDEYGVATKSIESGKEDKVTFVVNKKGAFKYYCSIGNHRQMGMEGTLVVE